MTNDGKIFPKTHLGTSYEGKVMKVFAEDSVSTGLKGIVKDFKDDSFSIDFGREIGIVKIERWKLELQ